jgi:hypothetical protein
MSILLGPDAAVGSHAPGGGAEGVMSPSEKRRMSNPALGGQAGVIDVEVLEYPDRLSEVVGGDQRDLQRDFVELCDGSCSVICCRMSPSQKGRMVMLMRRVHPNLCTLAIGDGANDVNMIQSANIGIGVRGKEGMQAVLASDYAITRFRFLLPLLLVHGHWNYRRQSKTILYVALVADCLSMLQLTPARPQISVLQEHVLCLHAVLVQRHVRVDDAAHVRPVRPDALQRCVFSRPHHRLRRH